MQKGKINKYVESQRLTWCRDFFFKGVVQIKPWEIEALGNKINKKVKLIQM